MNSAFIFAILFHTFTVKSFWLATMHSDFIVILNDHVSVHNGFHVLEEHIASIVTLNG
jgi:hypothetical protein